MKNTQNTLAWLLLAAALVAASAHASAQNPTERKGIKVSKDAGKTPAASRTPSPTTAVAGEVALSTPFTLATYANMNEQNMTAHMAGGDSLEVQLSQLAQTKATDARVREYAMMLVNDHTAHLAKTMEIVTHEHGGAEPLPGDPEAARMRQMLAELRAMAAGAKWDAAFLRFQVQHHQNELDLWPSVIQNARDHDLEALVRRTQQSLAKHRDTATSIATQLGVAL